MSGPEFRLELSEPAQRDFRDILSYTLQTWGEAQFATYRERIDAALMAIAVKPHAGRKAYGLLVQAVERHRIYYRIEDRVIFIIRILHERMDAPRHLR